MSQKAQALAAELQLLWDQNGPEILKDPLKFLLKRLGVVQDYGMIGLSRLFLVGQPSLDNANPVSTVYETLIGELKAFEPGIVVFVPSEYARAQCVECGLLVRTKLGFTFTVLMIPSNRYQRSVDLSLILTSGGETSILLSRFDGDRDMNNMLGSYFGKISASRFENELKPWLDHWLPQ